MVRVFCVVLLCCVLAEGIATAGENQEYLKLMEQGRAEYVLGRFGAAEALFLKALSTLQPGDERERAVALIELGDAYATQDALNKAERAYSESLTIYKRLNDKTHIALVLRNLGSLYSLQWRNDDALRVLQEALKLLKERPVPIPALIAKVLNSLGIVYYRKGQFGKAESLFNQAMELASPLAFPFDNGELENNLAAVYHAKRNFKKAEAFYKESLTLAETALGPAHPDLVFTLSALGMLYTETKRYAEAEDQFQRALDILEPEKLTFETRIARILHRLGDLYVRSKRNPEAETVLAQAATIARRNVDQHPDMVLIMEDYSAALKDAGKRREADELRAEARRARVKAGLVINAHSPF